MLTLVQYEFAIVVQFHQLNHEHQTLQEFINKIQYFQILKT